MKKDMKYLVIKEGFKEPYLLFCKVPKNFNISLWKSFENMDTILQYYKENILRPVNYPNPEMALSKEEFNLILEIWNTYKDLI